MKTVSPASGILLGGFFAGLCDFITPSVQFVMKGGEWYQPWKGVAGGIFLVRPRARVALEWSWLEWRRTASSASDDAGGAGEASI